MSLEQNSPDKVHQRPESWNDDHTLQAETVIPAPEHRDDKHDKKGMSLKTKVGLFLAGLGLAGTGGMVAKSVAGGEAAPAPERNPVSSAPANPGETAEPTTKAPEATAEFTPSGLSVEQYQDGDALIRAFNDEKNEWVMSGIDKEDTVDWADPENSIRSIAQEYDEAYINALFVSEWRENAELAEMVGTFTRQHEITLNASIMTTDSTKPEDKEPYEQSDEVTMTQVEESTPDRMVVSYRFVMHSNADQNRGDAYIENVNGREGGGTVTFVNENGAWKISGIQKFDG